MTDVGPAESAAPADGPPGRRGRGGRGGRHRRHADTADTAEPADTALAPTALEVLELSPEQWRIVAVAAVEMELPSVNPEVVLHEAQDPWRELRIPVGMAEGTAIAFAFRGIDTPRPLTHELVTDILDRHAVGIEAVRITVRRGQQFFAEIDTMGPQRAKRAALSALRRHRPGPAPAHSPPRSSRPSGCSPVPTPRRVRRAGPGSPTPAAVRSLDLTAPHRAAAGRAYATRWAVAWSATMARSPSSEMRISSAMRT